MKNNIQRIRIDKGLTQPEVVERIALPFIDVPMLSRLERGICLPTEMTLERLASALSCDLEDLYELGKEDYLYFRTRHLSHQKRSESFEVTELMIEIPHGAENAIHKRDLMHALDVSDRKLSKLISEARQCGYIILAMGRGYYQTTEEEEVKRYLERLNKRRLSIDNVLAALNSKIESEDF